MIINGQSGAIEQPMVTSFSPGQGVTTQRSWICTSETAADELINSLGFAGYATTKRGGPVFTVDARFGGDANNSEVPQDNHELQVNKVQKDFLDADHNLVNALNPGHVQQFRNYMQNPNDFDNQGGFVYDSTDPDSFASAEYLWLLYLAGVRSIEVRQPILKLTRHVSRKYSVYFEYQNVGKVLSTTTMINDSYLPNDFLIPINSLVGNFADPNRRDGITVRYGWLKEAPTLTLVGYTKRQIQQEYTFGLYDTSLYNSPL